MTKQNLRALLMDCAEKLNLYRGQHSGEYVGGVEYMELQRRIVKALDELPAVEPHSELDILQRENAALKETQERLMAELVSLKP